MAIQDLHDRSPLHLQPFAMPFGHNKFASYEEAIAFSLMNTDTDKDYFLDQQEYADAQQVMANAQTLFGESATAFITKSVDDTSPGGNDAMNCLPQFCAYDDIIHPLSQTDETGMRGMGRVYKEMYDDNQQIMWLSFGVPKFTGLTDFYQDAANSEVSKLMNSGEVPIWSKGALKLGQLIGTAGRLAFEFPWLPIKLLRKAYKAIDNSESFEIGAYFHFRPTMPLYFRMVNVLWSHLSIALGFYGNGGRMDWTDGELAKTYDREGGGGTPDILKGHGPDIFYIMNKRVGRLQKRHERSNTPLQDIIDEYNAGPKGKAAYYSYDDGELFGGHATGGSDYIGLRIEKSTESGESISNATGAPSVASTLNSKASSAIDKRFTLNGGKTGISVIDSLVGGITSSLQGLASGFGAGGAYELISGNGYYDIPDMWKSSSFSKNYSIKIPLRARAGDPVSIFQQVYLPLCMILAGALPRSIGKTMYTSPFIVKAYSSGMFSIPCGIITSCQIRRGLPEFGWSSDGLPTNIDVTIQIKDLSPAFFISIADDGILSILRQNTKLQDYMNTLAGLGLREHTHFVPRMARRWHHWRRVSQESYFTWAHWSIKLGHNPHFRAFTGQQFSSSWHTPTR